MSTLTDARTDEWREWRRAGLGGSDVAAIVGLSPWRSPYALWAEKVGLVEGDQVQAETDSMEFGRRIEPVLARWFEDRTGLYAIGEQTWCRHPEKPWAKATVDWFGGEYKDSATWDALGPAEAKTTADAPDKWAEELPAHYQCQGQWILAVTGYEHLWLPTLHFAFGRREFRVHELERDEADIAFLMTEAERFWFEHVVTGDPPPTDGTAATTAALKAAWKADPPGPAVDLTDRAFLIGIWKDAKADVARAKADLEAASNALMAELGDATEGHVGGQLAVSWRPQRRESYVVQESTFRVLRPHKTTADLKQPPTTTQEKR